jgi:DNA-binding transcriptional LysR family regulator
MTLVGFPGSESEKGLEANDALDRALHRFKQSHPNTAIVLTITPDAPDFSKAEPGADLAFIPARLLSDLVGKGGIEPLGARLSAEWLKDFPAESLAQCKAGGILFAVPWLKAEKPEDNWLLISFALSLHKPEAVELMKFLASDPAALSASRRQAGR